jgi:hypothetical protein
VRIPLLVDTNVCVVANGLAPQASDDCRLRCIALLDSVRRESTLLVDSLELILEEYLDNLSVTGQPGPGDAFLKWLWDNQGYADILVRIPIHQAPPPQYFVEFPRADNLVGFDPSDRKFVAVAIASGLNPPIHNAVDSDWWRYGEPLAANGVRVVNICPDQIEHLA